MRDFQEDKVDVIWRYTPEESRKLAKAGFIPQNSVFEKNVQNDFASNIEFYDNQIQNKTNEDDDEIMNEKNSRRYDMPSSDDTSEEEQEEHEETNNHVNDYAKNTTDNKKLTDDINIDNI